MPRSFVAIFSTVITGILFGTAEALLWVFGFVPNVRAILPYAVADALLIFAAVPFLALCAGRTLSARFDGYETGRIFRGLGRFAKATMTAGAVFLIFAQVFVGIMLPRAGKIAMVFAGSISFWVMFLLFLAMIYYIFRRH